MFKKLVLIFLILMQPVYSQTFFGKYYKEIFTASTITLCIGYILKLRAEVFGLKREAWKKEHATSDRETQTLPEVHHDAHPPIRRNSTTLKLSDE